MFVLNYVVVRFIKSSSLQYINVRNSPNINLEIMLGIHTYYAAVLINDIILVGY